MKNRKLTRKHLKTKLKDYVNGNCTIEELDSWKDSIWQNNYEYSDWDSDDSLINEVLHRIDMQDVDEFSVSLAKKIVVLLDKKRTTKELIEELYSLENKNETK